MIDRYTKIVLTVIACALVYLAILFTPLPRVSAQVPSARPGEPSGPTQVVVVGWRGDVAVPVFSPQPLRIAGEVTTERSNTGLADRVVVVGWERGASREKPSGLLPLVENLPAIPVRTTP